MSCNQILTDIKMTNNIDSMVFLSVKDHQKEV